MAVELRPVEVVDGPKLAAYMTVMLDHRSGAQNVGIGKLKALQEQDSECKDQLCAQEQRVLGSSGLPLEQALRKRCGALRAMSGAARSAAPAMVLLAPPPHAACRWGVVN